MVALEIDWQSLTQVQPNKSLHWPPVDPAHVYCHASCTVMIIASHEVRQLPGASELNR